MNVADAARPVEYWVTKPVQDKACPTCKQNDRPHDLLNYHSSPRSSLRKFPKVEMRQPCSARRLSPIYRAIILCLLITSIDSSVRWYKEIEMKKGAGVSQGGSGFQEWFHGVITRKAAEVHACCGLHK